MEKKDILNKLAPCGLDCSRCAGFKTGEIAELSRRLLDELGEYRRMAGIIKNFNPAFAAYESFDGILKHFSAASCGGCRYDPDGCPVPCVIKTCHKEQQVDFCFECSQFPCDRQAGIPIGERWLQMNQQMQEMGLEAYCDYQAARPRY